MRKPPRTGRRAGRARSLRRVWSTTVVTFVAAILVVAALAAAAVQWQRTEFRETTSSLEDETTALIELDRSVVETAGPAIVILYRAGKPEEVDAARSQYEVLRTEVQAAFGRARDALHTSDERALLTEAHDLWTSIDAAVMASTTEYTDAELAALWEAGNDPFKETVWDPYDELDRQRAALRKETVRDLRATLADSERRQTFLLPALAALLAVVMIVALLTVRRMTRRVLTPLALITGRADAMSDVNVDAHVDVGDAVAELQHLSETLDETAATLRISHGLLDQQVHTDLLTKLPNRKAFAERLHEMLDDGAVERVAVMFIDLDDFKDVNDSLGHAAGDELLEVVGQRLQTATRHCELVARLGGDEFAVAVDATIDPGSPLTVADRILETIETPLQIQGTRVRVGCSIGIATAEPGAGSEAAETLLANADFAMYMAKSQGKHRYELHSAAMHTDMLDRMELRRDLSDALASEQFELHYQPVIDLGDGHLIGFEALIRWHHPTRGLVAPDEFIGMAEDSGSIVPIGQWVLEQACTTLASVHHDDPSLAMSVNVAPAQLAEPTFAATVVEILERHGIAPDRLTLEITEATAMTSTANSIGALNELRAHGVHVALDDFGTGFSSLRYLGDLPADVIKIDRSFVSGRGANEASMLESIITLAQRLGLQVVAEGIEVAGDLDRLSGYADIAGQGYLFARPMPAGMIREFRESIADAPAQRDAPELGAAR